MVQFEEMTVDMIADNLFERFSARVSEKLADQIASHNYGVLKSEYDPYREGSRNISYVHYLRDVTVYSSMIGEMNGIAKTYIEASLELDNLARETFGEIKKRFVLKVMREYSKDPSLVIPMSPEEFQREEGKEKALKLHNRIKEMERQNLVSILGQTKNEIIADLKEDSIRDPLTRLYNRRYFDEKLIEEVERIRRRKNGLTVSLALFDIDDFKEKINDEYGHQIGDEVLKYVSEALRSELRRNHTVARYGGEEFAIILTDVKKEDAERITESRIERVRDYVTTKVREYIAAKKREGKELKDFRGEVTISAGISTLNIDSNSPEGMIRHADEALYYVKKKKGKDGFEHYDPAKKGDYLEISENGAPE